MKTTKDFYDRLKRVACLGSAIALLGWDQEVNLPPKGFTYRGEVSAQLAADLHRLSTEPKFVALVSMLNSPAKNKNLTAGQKVDVRETWRDVQLALKLPTKFVEEFTKLTSESFAAWAEARQKSDFSIFKSLLKKIVDMNRRQADYLGYRVSPYDALIDMYEPGMTSVRLEQLFTPLSAELKSLISKASTPKNLPRKNYPIDAQKQLNETVAKDLGYDLQAGRIDASPHPFTASFHTKDVRITTRYDLNDFYVSLGSIIHEVGHALYEQGLPANKFGTPQGTSVSLGIHESQSRLWENFVGRSAAFVDYLYPLMQKYFGKLPYTPNDLYGWLNRVQPSLIRVESDEVTYNMHIILRFEIEKGLLEKTVKVDDLPSIWNQKMKDYLGVQVPNDAKGLLQDIHWSHGTLGYFPTYSLGNLNAAQLFNKIRKDIKGLDGQFAVGNFKPFLKWLRKNIHAYGRTYSPEELIIKTTGEPLNPEYLLAHLERKVAQ